MFSPNLQVGPPSLFQHEGMRKQGRKSSRHLPGVTQWLGRDLVMRMGLCVSPSPLQAKALLDSGRR